MSLGHEREMDRLNRLRVDLKHHSITIAESEIERARVNTTNFFEENTPIIFGIDFDEISMTDSVEYQPARDYLNLATRFMEQEKFGEAVNKIAIAFDMIMDEYLGQKMSVFGTSPIQFEPKFHHYDRMYDGVKRIVNDSIQPLKKPIEIMSLGLDYQKYVMFRRLTPEVMKVLKQGGGYHYFEMEPSKNITEGQCQFCLDFVIDSAFRIQEFDFDIKL
jgi:hypothetical protein